MAIYGIEGGIGTGKTLTGHTIAYNDLLTGKHLYTNIKLKNTPKHLLKNVTYMTKDLMMDIFEKVKTGTWDMTNSTVFIQEAHNYMDSRNSASKKNKVLSYWILQSRHTGKGSCDIIYDTQALSQVDIRLRRNTDFILHPHIFKWEHTDGIKKPCVIVCEVFAKIGHKDRKFSYTLDVRNTRETYDTHEVVDF